MKKLILGMMLSALPGLAGDVVGNGGDGIRRGGKLYLLDLVEVGKYLNPVVSKKVRPDKETMDRIAKAMDLEPAVQKILAIKLKEIESYNFALSHALLETMEEHQWAFTNETLANVGDENSPIRGKFIQIAVRQTPQIFINIPTFRSMNEINQAALILHELVYSVLAVCHGGIAEKCTQPSWLVRQAIGQFFSSDFSTPGSSLKGDLADILPFPRFKSNYRRKAKDKQFLARSVYYKGLQTYLSPHYPASNEGSLTEVCEHAIGSDVSLVTFEHSFERVDSVVQRNQKIAFIKVFAKDTDRDEKNLRRSSRVQFRAGSQEDCEAKVKLELDKLEISYVPEEKPAKGKRKR